MTNYAMKYILVFGGLGAAVYSALRILQDGVGGEAIGTNVMQTAAILFGFAAVIQALECSARPRGG